MTEKKEQETQGEYFSLVNRIVEKDIEIEKLKKRVAEIEDVVSDIIVTISEGEEQTASVEPAPENKNEQPKKE